jgi:hypothetical protein
MALSIGVSVGSKILVGGHMVQVKALVYPNVVVVTVDRGDEIVISEGQATEILPGVRVQSGIGGNRLAFQRTSRFEFPRWKRQRKVSDDEDQHESSEGRRRKRFRLMNC